MRFNISREWCLKMAAVEAEIEGTLAAGTLALDPMLEINDSKEPLYAFSRFVSLLRRNENLTVESLANKAEIDVIELYQIEENLCHTPDLRTVYQLSNYFRVPRKRMLEIAGLVKPQSNIIEEATKFAARSEPLVELSKQERTALNDFIKFLDRT